MTDKLRVLVDFAMMHCERKNITVPLDILIGYAQAFKTLAYFERVMRRLVQTLYDGQIGGEFVEIAQNLISGQMRKAYEEAWKDDGNEGALPNYLAQAAERETQRQMEFVSPFYRAIIDARVDGNPAAPLLDRVDGWTRQYDVAKREAVRLMGIQNGVKQKWIKGETEHGCQTCADLDGIILYAKEWEALGVHPRGYPNPMLDCEGGGPVNNCDCNLVATDQRRTAKGYEVVLNMMTARKV